MSSSFVEPVFAPAFVLLLPSSGGLPSTAVYAFPDHVVLLHDGLLRRSCYPGVQTWVLRERLTEPTSVDDAVDVCPGNGKMLGHAFGCSPELQCIDLAGEFSWPRKNCAKHR